MSESLYTVRKGTNQILMTKPIATFSEAESHAIRLSKEASFTVKRVLLRLHYQCANMNYARLCK